MALELFAQGQNQAFEDGRQAGMVIGIILAIVVSASIPIAVGVSRRQPILGAVGAVFAVPAAFLFGCLGGLPVAGLFSLIILAVSSGSSGRPRKKRRQPRYDDDDDYDDRPRRRRRDDDD